MLAKYLPSLALISFIVASGVAQCQREMPPSCAYGCIAKYSLGNCEFGDTKCMCTDKEYMEGTRSCIEYECEKEDYELMKAASDDRCKEYQPENIAKDGEKPVEKGGEPAEELAVTDQAGSDASPAPSSPTTSSAMREVIIAPAKIAMGAFTLGSIAISYYVI